MCVTCEIEPKSKEKEKITIIACLFAQHHIHIALAKHVRALLKLFYSILCDCGKWLYVFPHVINFERTRAVNVVCFSQYQKHIAIADNDGCSKLRANDSPNSK